MAVEDRDVKAIIETDLDTTPFIDVASTIVSEELGDKGLSSERLRIITLYLAAHFCCITVERGGLKRSKLGDADDSYNIPAEKDSGFAFTRYGQMALVMDTSGTLAKMSANKGLKAQFEVVGSPNIGTVVEDDREFT